MRRLIRGLRSNLPPMRESVNHAEDLIERLASHVQATPEASQLYRRLLDHVQRSGVDRLVMLLDVLESQQGHQRSRTVQKAVDAAGHPLPWLTYPAIEYLDHLDLSGCRLLETGAGQGTLYWARRVAQVMVVEHDPVWGQQVKSALPDNATIVMGDSDEVYLRAVSEAPGRFQIIVIDGKLRRRCAEIALPKLSDTGMIILDNAEWYPNTAKLLREAGLIEVDFHGFGPVVDFKWTTSLFLTTDFKPRPKDRCHPPVVIGAQANECEDD